MEECLYKRFKCFMNFNEFSMYLFRWKRGGGALMHVYVTMRTQSQPLLQNRLMYVYETWWGWSARGPLQVLLFFGQICPGADPGRGQKGHGGSPSSTNFCYRLEGYSNKRNAKQWSRSMWHVVLLLLVPFQSQIFDAFSTSYWTYSHYALF